jgi:hypothetical protein
MGKETEQLMSALSRLDTSLDVQWGRIGLMERWLEDHSTRLQDLSKRIDANLARLEALVGRRKG